MSAFYEDYWKEKKSDVLDDFGYKWPVLKNYIPLKEGLKILDYGCGAGKLLRELKSLKPNNKYFGADVSKEALLRAKKTLQGVRFLAVEDGKKIPISSGGLDFILAADVIEHVYDTKLLFQEFFRILKKGGEILITTPYHGLIKNLAIVFFGFEKVFDPTGPHIRFFTVNSLRRSLIEAGFRVAKVGYFGRFYPLSRGFIVKAKK